MSEYMFGVRYEKPTRRDASRWDRIAREYGGGYVEVNIDRNDAPGINHGNYQAWFAIPNAGEPFNSATAREVLNRCGIAPKPKA